MHRQSALQRALRRDATGFRRLLKKTARDPTADRVHDLRVVTRRLRADFWLVPVANRSSAHRKARHDLKDLTRVLGEQRKYDVALEDAHRYGRATKSIRKQLKARRREVRASLRARRRRRYLRRVERAIRRSAELNARALAPRLRQLRRRLEHATRHPPRSKRTRHHLRINVKKTRYVLDALDCGVPALARLQDCLGRWHDLTVLAALSGHPKELDATQRRQWKRVDACLVPALRRTIAALTALLGRLEQSSA